MPRKPRLHVPGGVYHVILRGNGAQDIFFDPADRRYFYGLLKEGTQRFGYRIHAFCLMSNHVHLVLQVGETPLARPMQNLSFRYARRINWRTQRSGHLFQGRYKALLVDADSYLLELVRYVHLNPVRAGLVRQAEDHPWSSHRCYLARERLPWLTTDWVLEQFGRRVAEARSGFKSFVADDAKSGPHGEFHLGEGDSRVLGDDHFLARTLEAKAVEGPAPELDAIIGQVCARYGIESDELAARSRRHALSLARGVVGYMARETAAATIGDIARRFDRDPTTMSHAVRRVEDRAAQDSRFAGQLRALKDAIMQA